MKRIFKRESVAVVSFAVWEEGLVILKANPKRIRSVEDLARKSITLVNREPGSGSRMSQQNENVLFGQSRNVLLTGSSLGRGPRTTADDPGRARPASG